MFLLVSCNKLQPEYYTTSANEIQFIKENFVRQTNLLKESFLGLWQYKD